ncbi:hypothetical protein H0Z60_14600 [Ectothiorhodospiraceae bacterium WFHF3C12]|nr:hypothetical protein [Ectothiorhodospiraceae bacterium WFHF3C12]
MRGAIGLPDYQAEVTVSECDLRPLPEGLESAATEVAPDVFPPRDRFHRSRRVADEPQKIRDTWLDWIREAEAQAEPPQVLAVRVYSHREDWHTDEPMILIYDKARRCYRVLA